MKQKHILSAIALVMVILLFPGCNVGNKKQPYSDDVEPKAYSTATVEDNFIDNQVLLFLFRYGLIPTILYLYLLISPIVKSVKIKNKKMILKSAVLFSWFLAMMGLGVYFSISFGMAHMLIMLYTGRLFYETKCCGKLIK